MLKRKVWISIFQICQVCEATTSTFWFIAEIKNTGDFTPWNWKVPVLNRSTWGSNSSLYRGGGVFFLFKREYSQVLFKNFWYIFLPHRFFLKFKKLKKLAILPQVTIPFYRFYIIFWVSLVLKHILNTFLHFLKKQIFAWGKTGQFFLDIWRMGQIWTPFLSC